MHQREDKCINGLVGKPVGDSHFEDTDSSSTILKWVLNRMR